MGRSLTALLTLTAVGVVTGCADEMAAPAEPVLTESFAHLPAGAEAGTRFVAPLSSREEVPAPDLTATRNPRGQATLRLDAEAEALDYRLIVANIENVTQSHIHCGLPGVAGPVVAFLFGFVDGGVSVDGILAEGTVTAADVIVRPSSEACPGGVANFDELIAHMHAGTAYVNVHTVQNPPGEIRGQIRGVGAP